MTGWLDIYLQQFRTTLAATIQYRASLVIWLIGAILEPVVYLVVWTQVSAHTGGAVGGFGPGEFAAYFILLMLVNHVTYTWIMYEYEYRIRHGGLSFALLRPLHPIHADIAENISSKVISTPGMLAAAAVLTLLFHPVFHPEGWALLAAIPALLLAFLLRFALEWCLAQAAFWTTRVSALNQTYFVAVLFLSGQVAPLSLMPPAVQTVASLLPFRWMVGFPVELLLGRLTPSQALAGLGAQAVWIGAGLLFLRGVWRAGLKRYSAVGG